MGKLRGVKSVMRSQLVDHDYYRAILKDYEIKVGSVWSRFDSRRGWLMILGFSSGSFYTGRTCWPIETTMCHRLLRFCYDLTFEIFFLFSPSRWLSFLPFIHVYIIFIHEATYYLLPSTLKYEPSNFNPGH